MAPSQPARHLVVWSLPVFALFLSYYWYKKKRLGQQSDKRDLSKQNGEVIKSNSVDFCEGTKKEVSESQPIPQTNESPRKLYSRSLSGVNSAPIDIVLPPDMRAAKSNNMVISDEDLDFEIQKIKGMKSSYDRQKSFNTSPVKPVSPPIEETKIEAPSFEAIPLTVRSVEETGKEHTREEEEEEIETTVINTRVEAIDNIKLEEIDCTRIEQTENMGLEDTKPTQEIEEYADEESPKTEANPEVTHDMNHQEKETEPEMTVVDYSELAAGPPVHDSVETSEKLNESNCCKEKPESKPPPKGKKAQDNKLKKAAKQAQLAQNEVAQVEKISSMKVSGNASGNSSGSSNSNGTSNGNKKQNTRRSRNKNWVPMNLRSTPEKRVNSGNNKQGNNKHGNNKKEEPQRKSSDRDSANHSPVDVMMASPSLSNISDNGSSDSGKGGSDVATPPNYGASHTDKYLPSEQLVLHEFTVPSDLVGRLIGKKGQFVSQIKTRTNAEVVIKSYPEPFSDHKVCVIEGTPSEISGALKMIRRKFPLASNPTLTLEPLNSGRLELSPEKLCLKLVEGINNDTMVCCVESPAHLFVQFPTHPTFPSLVNLHNHMQACYQNESPELPNPVPVGAVCAALSKDSWYRALILATDGDSSYIKFLDWGGYDWIRNTDLMKIRQDFTSLPLQAAECILANIQPVGGPEAEWSDEAVQHVTDITRAALVYTQVAAYTADGIPLVLCYVSLDSNNIINLNENLVAKGLAEWVPQHQQGEDPNMMGAAAAAPTVVAQAVPAQ